MDGYEFIEVYLRAGGSIIVPAKRHESDLDRNMLILMNEMGRTVGEFHWEDIIGWGISCGTPMCEYDESEEYDEGEDE